MLENGERKTEKESYAMFIYIIDVDVYIHKNLSLPSSKQKTYCAHQFSFLEKQYRT